MIGLVAFVVFLLLPEAPEGFGALDDHLDRLSPPDSLELVETGDEGQGEMWFGERFTVVRVYATKELPATVCPSMQAALVEWGEIRDQPVVEGGTTEGCGFSGSIAGQGDDRFEVSVMPVRRYVAERSTSTAFWEGAATSSLATVVEVRAIQGG